ncbi:Transcription antitermination protein NusB [Candidatus Hydrogenisulfobacillus filiaventi]|uniref:Transcription antitermination protein NusB n=1 Tax=Candidatus Hydrogenisulfobacillus filiaventi TaxID=2707344 RepID=A0A6F8ZF77_9FIRM|nr:transcription antitermination factor NusB [Bacillota bacterium]CAB1128649.1 Transcription antitermination protein NusB [Candidatus Hydrogenisulfobacillus filiaventi]
MARHQARERALKALFEYDLVHPDLPGLLERTAAGLAGEDAAFALQLVEGTLANLLDIDARVARAATGWKLSRMPSVDRNILRMATFELMTGTAPPEVIIDEAVELARAFGTEQSYRFVNGVLAAVARGLRPAPEGGPPVHDGS